MVSMSANTRCTLRDWDVDIYNAGCCGGHIVGVKVGGGKFGDFEKQIAHALVANIDTGMNAGKIDNQVSLPSSATVPVTFLKCLSAMCAAFTETKFSCRPH